MNYKINLQYEKLIKIYKHIKIDTFTLNNNSFFRDNNKRRAIKDQAVCLVFKFFSFSFTVGKSNTFKIKFPKIG